MVYNKVNNKYYCNFYIEKKKCSILYCKTCINNDNYYCEECTSNYEVNILTGSCVKKTEVVPTVTWKDIYKLNMTDEKIINNKIYFGPSFKLRGITSSQINSGHAFLLFLNFILKHQIRNLQNEEKITIPAICEIINSVEETNDDVNMVEYDCIGNLINAINITDYTLDNIEEGNNINSLIKSNLNELVSDKKSQLGDLGQLTNIQNSSFTLEDLVGIVIFQMNQNIKNITANNYKFDFKIEGKLNKELVKEQLQIKKEFELVEVDNKAECIFTMQLNKNASLSCNLNVENHKDIKTFSFKTSQITTDNHEIYLAKFNDIILINSEEKKNENKTLYIVISVIGTVLVSILFGIWVFYLGKKIRPNKRITSINIINESNEPNVDRNNKMKIEGEKSTNRINKLEEK